MLSFPGAIARRGDAAATWLYGPTIDLLLGAGVAYLVAVPLLVVLDHRGLMGSWPVTTTALLSLFVAGPHYGATILRVYDRREDRQHYALFAIWATAVLAGLFVVGLHHILVGSILVTLYLTWSPWHFSGQNYGLSLMFLRRRGVQVDARTRRFLSASFVLSFVLSFLILHSAATTLTGPMSSESVFQFRSLGIPKEATRLAIRLTALAYVFTLAGAGLLLLRRARPVELLPVACLVLTQALWFALPAALPIVAGVRLDGPAFAALWLSAAHSAQYLWVTSFYASQQAREQAGPRGTDRKLALPTWWVRAQLAGSAVTLFPALVFAPRLLGTVPWDNGLALLLVSVVNIHHFVLDGAVWKLRDKRVARLLFRDARPASEPVTAPASRVAWGRSIVAAIGVVSLAVGLLDVWESEVVIQRAGEDIERIVRSSRRLAWIGRDSPSVHNRIAQFRASQDRLDDAIAEYQRSLALHPTLQAWLGLGVVHASRGQWREASEAYRAALALNPDDLTALLRSGRAWIALGRPDLARRDLVRARAKAPRNPLVQRELQRVAALESGVL